MIFNKSLLNLQKKFKKLAYIKTANGQQILHKSVSNFNLNFILSKPENIDYIDVSPKQLVSVAASLIPFFLPSLTKSVRPF